jgi:hypothetical protein
MNRRLPSSNALLPAVHRTRRGYTRAVEKSGLIEITVIFVGHFANFQHTTLVPIAANICAVASHKTFFSLNPHGACN